MCVTIFVSCDEAYSDEECVHTKGNWIHNESGHWQHEYCNLDKQHIYGPDPIEDHVDENKNGICDVCGYEYEECNHQWDDGVEVEGGSGGYVMEYTCLLCGNKRSETITIIPPENTKVQTTIGEEAHLPQFMSLEVDKHNVLSNGNSISVNVYMGYDILNKDGAAFSDIVVPESDFAKYTFVLEINYNNETRVIALDAVNYFEEYRCDMYQGVVQYSKYNSIQLDTTKMTEKNYGFVNVELYMISDTNERYFVSAETLYYSVTDTEIVFGLVSDPVANEGDPGIITNGWVYQETTP